MPFNAIDIVGDIHGHASALEALLRRLQYTKRDGVWCHPERQAVFVGDYVDRGEENLRTCRTIMDMETAGAALAVMGNHEFNQLALHTQDPDSADEYLRPHSAKNLKQAATTLVEFEKSPDDKHLVLNWMNGLPLWLDLPGIRVVHAYWSKAAQAILNPALNENKSIRPESFTQLTRNKTKEGIARAALLSGPEHRLPDGLSLTDAEGHKRHDVRLKWWLFEHLPMGLRDLAHVPYKDRDMVPDVPADIRHIEDPDSDTRPVAFGHYWMKPDELFLGPHHVCVDASVANGGKLAAYRFSGERELSPDNLVLV